MGRLLIFLPNTLKTFEFGVLRGVFKPSSEKNCQSFYVLDSTSSKNKSLGFDEIGNYFENGASTNWSRTHKYWLLVTFINDEPVVSKVYVNGTAYPLENCHVILYDKSALVTSELFLDKARETENYEGDYFAEIAYQLKQVAPQDSPSMFDNRLVLLITAFFECIAYCLEKFSFLTRFTTIGLHLKQCTSNIIWLLTCLRKDKRSSLQCGNYVVSLILDILGGFLVTSLIADFSTNVNLFNWTAFKTEAFLDSINLTIKWLMGSPAGLKLNYPLNYILGNFFLYNIYLWWTFLKFVRPILETGFYIFLELGFMGLSFQLALLADIFSLVSFHLYCIYIYAARLYELQLKGVRSLSRIFLGRKRNPEPGKVDSCPYTNEQLFLGTVCFTVLLFLLPTTLVYYIVFTLMRLVVILIGGVLTRTRYLLQILPLYSSIIWVFYPKLTTTTIRLIPVNGMSNEGVVTLIAEPAKGSWLTVVERSIPEELNQPKTVDWKEIIENVCTGKLLYPI